MSVSNLIFNARKSYQKHFPGLFIQNWRRESMKQQKGKSREDLTVLENSHQKMQILPSRTILLGQCEDGLPFLMGLGDPDIGAILISGEVGCGKTRQLQIMVDSAAHTHFPHELQIVILTSNPGDWDSLKAEPGTKKHLHAVHAWNDAQAERVIKSISELAEARRLGQRQGADILFLLDGFDAVEELSYEAQVNLHWLLEYGSQSGVWIVSTIKADLAEGFRYWINTFRTRIVGRIELAENADVLAMKPGPKASGLMDGAFRVWAGSSWLTYQLLPLEG